MTKVEIQVQRGKVTIVIGGASSSTPSVVPGVPSGVVSGKVIGGDVMSESGQTGGAVSQCSGVLVIGPIVVAGGADWAESDKQGGDVMSESGQTGGSVAGAGGLVVIGPIVIGGGGRGATETTPTAIKTHVDPGDEE
jgi:hypothetical protein